MRSVLKNSFSLKERHSGEHELFCQRSRHGDISARADCRSAGHPHARGSQPISVLDARGMHKCSLTCRQLISACIQMSALPGSPLLAIRTCSDRKDLRGSSSLALHRAHALSTYFNGLRSGSCFRRSGVLPLRKRLS